jgi:hypothetical protein
VDVTPRIIRVLEVAIESGIALGTRRAYKHNDAPTQQQLQVAIESAIWTELHEWFVFEKENHE